MRKYSEPVAWGLLSVVLLSQIGFVILLSATGAGSARLPLLPWYYWAGLIISAVLTMCGYFIFDYMIAPGFHTWGSALVYLGIASCGIITALSQSAREGWTGQALLIGVWSLVALVGSFWRLVRGSTDVKSYE